MRFFWGGSILPDKTDPLSLSGVFKITGIFLLVLTPQRLSGKQISSHFCGLEAVID